MKLLMVVHCVEPWQTCTHTLTHSHLFTVNAIESLPMPALCDQQTYIRRNSVVVVVVAVKAERFAAKRFHRNFRILIVGLVGNFQIGKKKQKKKTDLCD